MTDRTSALQLVRRRLAKKADGVDAQTVAQEAMRMPAPAQRTPDLKPQTKAPNLAPPAAPKPITPSPQPTKPAPGAPGAGNPAMSPLANVKSVWGQKLQNREDRSPLPVPPEFDASGQMGRNDQLFQESEQVRQDAARNKVESYRTLGDLNRLKREAYADADLNAAKVHADWKYRNVTDPKHFAAGTYTKATAGPVEARRDENYAKDQAAIAQQAGRLEQLRNQNVQQAGTPYDPASETSPRRSDIPDSTALAGIDLNDPNYPAKIRKNMETEYGYRRNPSSRPITSVFDTRQYDDRLHLTADGLPPAKPVAEDPALAGLTGPQRLARQSADPQHQAKFKEMMDGLKIKRLATPEGALEHVGSNALGGIGTRLWGGLTAAASPVQAMIPGQQDNAKQTFSAGLNDLLGKSKFHPVVPGEVQQQMLAESPTVNSLTKQRVAEMPPRDKPTYGRAMDVANTVGRSALEAAAAGGAGTKLMSLPGAVPKTLGFLPSAAPYEALPDIAGGVAGSFDAGRQGLRGIDKATDYLMPNVVKENPNLSAAALFGAAAIPGPQRGLLRGALNASMIPGEREAAQFNAKLPDSSQDPGTAAEIANRHLANPKQTRIELRKPIGDPTVAGKQIASNPAVAAQIQRETAQIEAELTKPDLTPEDKASYMNALASRKSALAVSQGRDLVADAKQLQTGQATEEQLATVAKHAEAAAGASGGGGTSSTPMPDEGADKPKTEAPTDFIQESLKFFEQAPFEQKLAMIVGIPMTLMGLFGGGGILQAILGAGAVAFGVGGPGVADDALAGVKKLWGQATGNSAELPKTPDAAATPATGAAEAPAKAPAPTLASMRDMAAKYTPDQIVAMGPEALGGPENVRKLKGLAKESPKSGKYWLSWKVPGAENMTDDEWKTLMDIANRMPL